ncbi:hypothetical protein [Streptomyces sp. NPDC002067]
MLRTPGSAVVWWLARHGERVEDAVRMIGPLARLSAAAHDTEVPETFRHLAAEPPGHEPLSDGTQDRNDGTSRTPVPSARRTPLGTGLPTATGLAAVSDPDEAREQDDARDPDDMAAEHVARLIGALGLAEGSPEHIAYVEDIARATDALGRTVTAARIRHHLTTCRRASPGA